MNIVMTHVQKMGNLEVVRSASKQDVCRLLARFAVPLFCLLVLCGCGKDLSYPGGGERFRPVEVILAIEPMDETTIQTRADFETDIRYLNVYQFSSDGLTLLSVSQFGPTIESPDAFDKISLKLRQEESKVYFAANMRDLPINVQNVEQLKSFTSRWDGKFIYDWYENNGLPFVGYWEGNPGDNPTFEVRMIRCVCKLTVNMAVDLTNKWSSLTINRIYASAVPTSIWPFREFIGDPGTDQTLCYPLANAPNAYSSDYSSQSVWKIFDNAEEKYGTTPCYVGSLYLSENARGKGSATEENQKDATHALGGRAQGAFATYLKIDGTYTTDLDANVPVTYTIYLGGNMVDDYNLFRNKHYNLTVTIRSMNTADARVSIGNPSYASGSPIKP